MCLCIQLCNFILWGDLWNNYFYRQGTELLHHHKGTPWYVLPYLHTSVLVPWQPLIGFHVSSFVISKMFYKWNHTVHSLWGLTYFICLMSLRSIQDMLYVSTHGGTRVYVNIHPLKNLWVASRFFLLWVKLLWTCVHRLGIFGIHCF